MMPRVIECLRLPVNFTPLPTLSPITRTTCLSLSVGEDLAADPGHAGYGIGNDWSGGEGAQDLGLAP